MGWCVLSVNTDIVSRERYHELKIPDIFEYITPPYILRSQDTEAKGTKLMYSLLVNYSQCSNF